MDKEKAMSVEFADVISVLERARKQYPVPFSVFASELLFELSAPNPNWTRIFLLQIDCFESSVALFFFILFAEMEFHDTLVLQEVSNHLHVLRSGKNLSTGHWWAMLRSISQDINKAKDVPLSEASKVALSLFFPSKGNKSTSKKKFSDVLNGIPNIRNRVKGHSFTLPPEQYEQHAKDMLRSTATFFSVIEGIDDVTIFYVFQCMASPQGDFHVDIFLLNGDMRRPLRKNLRLDTSLPVGSVWIGNEKELEREPDIRTYRNLTPFIQYNSDGNHFFIAQHLSKDQFELLNIIGGERVHAENSQLGINRIDALIKRSVSKSDVYDRLVTRSKELAHVLLSSPAASASYDERTYLARPRIVQQLDSIGQRGNKNSQVRIWIASAPSGSGKTAMACDAIAKWNSEGRHNEIEVLALSSEILSAQGSIEIWWQQRFGESILQSCETAVQGEGIIRLFVDGLDRLGTPETLLNEIVNLFVHKSVNDVLRVIISSTEAVANKAVVLLSKKGMDKMLSRWSIPPLTPEEARKIFSLLNPDSAHVQLGSEVETLLTTPLLVRLAQVLGEDEAVVGITPGRLLRAHADRTVLADPIRSHLALQIVRHILDEEKKSISLNDLLQDDSLKSLLLTTGENSPLQQLVRDHVLLLDKTPSPNGLPLPSKTMLSFAFDAQLDYLAFALLAQEYGTDPAAWSEHLKGKASFGPLVGALRVFFVESLLENPAHEQILKLASTLQALEETGHEVLKDLLTVGLKCTKDASFHLFLKAYIQQEDEHVFISLADDAVHRLVIAGRVQAATELIQLVRMVAPLDSLVPLLCTVINITAWALDIPQAYEMANDLVHNQGQLSLASQIQAFDIMREVCQLSGLATDLQYAHALETKLEELYNAHDNHSPTSIVIVELLYARRANKLKDGLKREEHLVRAEKYAQGNASLLMSVALTKALLYADEALNIQSRSERQAACQEAVLLACSIGNPFAEALACDICASAWHTNFGIQLDWIDRGLIAASALHAKVARARLLDKRGRIYLSYGQLEDALNDARMAAQLFDMVGHQRHALRTKQHLYALEVHEMDTPGVAFQAWDDLAAQADTLGLAFLQRLLRLLKASMLCDVGEPDKAEVLIAEVQKMSQEVPLQKDVYTSMFEGKVAYARGDISKAVSLWQKACDEAKAIGLADVLFQAVLHMSWGKLLWAGRESSVFAQEQRKSVINVVRTLLEENTFEHQRMRYAGELRLVLALALLCVDWMEEAKSRLSDAQVWFAEHPKHPLQVELKFVVLLFAEKEADQDANAEEGSKEREKNEKIRLGKRKGYIKQCETSIHQLAQSFPTEETCLGYTENHRVNRFIRCFLSH